MKFYLLIILLIKWTTMSAVFIEGQVAASLILLGLRNG
ncbi:hypothetical protein ENC_28660 [Enterobacter hormaechei]|nr:hypothetical protein Y59_35070 [Enterobacter hormaechei]CBK86311.1 hypothetical protein ENC_28660 [Enterobacter hormaechei]